jgi:hypothetical protein
MFVAGLILPCQHWVLAGRQSVGSTARRTRLRRKPEGKGIAGVGVPGSDRLRSELN